MPKQNKIDTVAELKEHFSSASSFFVTDYQGLNVADISTLRKNLRENKVKYVVARNTLFKLAASQAGAPDVAEHLKGPTAIAFTGSDVSIAAKILNDSFKDKQLPRVKVFVVDNHVHKAADIQRIADLPSREILLSQLVAAIESPLTSLVGSLDAVFSELCRTVEALAEQKKAG